MKESTWLTCPDPCRMLDYDSRLDLIRMGAMFEGITRELESGRHPPGAEPDFVVGTDWQHTRKTRLLAIACCRTVWDWLPADPSQKAIEIAELHADGLADPKVLKSIRGKVTRAYNKASAPIWLGEVMSEEEAERASLTSNMLDAVDSLLKDIEHFGCADICRAVADVAASVSVDGPPAAGKRGGSKRRRAKARADSLARQADLMRDIFGNPFRPVALDPAWLTPTVLSLARQMYESRDFSAMPILADALQDAGCEHADILPHCRGNGPHVLGCWVVDLLLGKE